VPEQFGDPNAERAVVDYLSSVPRGEYVLEMTVVSNAAKLLKSAGTRSSAMANRQLVVKALGCMMRRGEVLKFRRHVKLGSLRRDP